MRNSQSVLYNAYYILCNSSFFFIIQSMFFFIIFTVLGVGGFVAGSVIVRCGNICIGVNFVPCPFDLFNPNHNLAQLSQHYCIHSQYFT